MQICFFTNYSEPKYESVAGRCVIALMAVIVRDPNFVNVMFFVLLSKANILLLDVHSILLRHVYIII